MFPRLLVAALLFLLLQTAVQAQEPVGPAEILAQRIKPNMLLVRTFGPHQQLRVQGSAFLVSDRGHAVTNFHVLDGAYSATASFVDDTEQYEVTLCAIDPRRDLAVIRVKLPQNRVRTGLEFEMESPREGTEVWAFGFQAGLGYSVTRGVVNGIREVSQLSDILNLPRLNLDPSLRLIQHDSAVNPGNSGGPLVNREGKVVGVNTFMLRNANSVYFAVMISEVMKILTLLDNELSFEDMRQSRGGRTLTATRPGAPDRLERPSNESHGIDLSTITDYMPAQPTSLEQLRASLAALRSAFPSKCSRCNGSGRVVSRRIEGFPPYRREVTSENDCTACKGEGIFVGSADRMKRAITSASSSLAMAASTRSLQFDALMAQYRRVFSEQILTRHTPLNEIVSKSSFPNVVKHEAFVGRGVVLRVVGGVGPEMSYLIGVPGAQILVVCAPIREATLGRSVLFGGVWSDSAKFEDGRPLHVLRGAYILNEP